jgi:Tat protein secretion system quality control protein TatD with DNase activity
MYAPLIDGHSHILPSQLRHDAFLLRALLRRCQRYGIEAFALSIDCSSGQPEFDLEQLSAIFSDFSVTLLPTLGFMPPVDQEGMEHLEKRMEAAMNQVRRLAAEGKVAAIGEVGLDYYWPVVSFVEGASRETASATARSLPPQAMIAPHRACLEAQTEVFCRWIELARELELPLVIHERDAHAAVVQTLHDCPLPPERVMFHCFGSTPEDALLASQRGHWVSLPSSIFHRPPYQEVARVTPLEHLLIETDSPYHSPLVGLWKQCFHEAQTWAEEQSFQGRKKENVTQQERRRRFALRLEEDFPGLFFEVWRQEKKQTLPAAEYMRDGKARSRNEPTFVRYAAHQIAALKDLPLDEVCATLTQNARSFYHLNSSKGPLPAPRLRLV